MAGVIISARLFTLTHQHAPPLVLCSRLYAALDHCCNPLLACPERAPEAGVGAGSEAGRHPFQQVDPTYALPVAVVERLGLPRATLTL